MSVTDAELADGLTAALGRPVLSLVRRAWPYASSAPMEELIVPGAPPMLFKDLTPRARPSRPAFVVDPLRELEAYDVVDGVDAPAVVGSVVGEDRVWLFLERVDGVPLWQAPGLEPWEATARWLARLHRRDVPAASRLLRHDATHLRRWLERARALTPPGALDRVEPAAERAIERLASLPACLLHGELYPSNVLIQSGPDGPRVRPVDWETAGAGPGVLDLAALVSGDWEPARRARVVAAYAGGHPRAGDEPARDLDAAGLLVALQWLGWSAAWSPPAEHRHDWLAVAQAAARRLAG